MHGGRAKSYGRASLVARTSKRNARVGAPSNSPAKIREADILPLTGSGKVWSYAIASASIFLAGWSVNGWRLEAAYDKERADTLQTAIKVNTSNVLRSYSVEVSTLEKLAEVKKGKEDALNSASKKLRGVTVDNRIISVLSDYTNASDLAATAANIDEDTGTADASSDAEEETRIILDNYAKYNECRTQVIGWIDFYRALISP